MRLLIALLLPLLIISCDRTPNTPEAVAEKVLARLSSNDIDGAGKLFVRGESQVRWFKRYYDEQPIDQLFSGPVGNVFINGDEAVVTYTPAKTLFNAFGKEDLMLLKKEDGEWKADIEAAGRFKNAVNGGGVKTSLSLVGDSIDEVTRKLGRAPASVQEIVDHLEVAGAQSMVRNFTRNYDYHPEGKTIDGVSGVIFYSKRPYRYGMHLGATKDRLFLSGDGQVVIDEKISLF
ncbi:hypothetical protein [Haloferula rosea]|uniref:Uncharacterized protein n=1 Tax=Haloferula rosea TaxID=490093 RepID=A0A934VHC0_9BACT|nr:hypothetical protein [Haloferula rosea]MBK1828500.1 hypothetical protein [Haloferula rosea]